MLIVALFCAWTASSATDTSETQSNVPYSDVSVALQDGNAAAVDVLLGSVLLPRATAATLIWFDSEAVSTQIELLSPSMSST